MDRYVERVRGVVDTNNATMVNSPKKTRRALRYVWTRDVRGDTLKNLIKVRQRSVRSEANELPRPRTLDKYWGYFLFMQGNASTMRFSENQGVTHHLPCSKGGQQGDGDYSLCCDC